MMTFAHRLTHASTLMCAALILSLAACGGGGDGSTGTAGAPGSSGTPGAVGAPGTPGAPGKNLASRSSAEPMGVNCAAGGVRLQTGLDNDASGVLDESEVQQTAYLCNGMPGVPGMPGAQGAQGTPGAPSAPGTPGMPGVPGTPGAQGIPGEPGIPGIPGAPGMTGTSGLNSLIRTAPEPFGANCPAGGLRIQTGVDTSGNGVLEPGEVQAASYVCNAAAAATSKAWGTAELIEGNEGGAGAPQIATDANGNATAVWLQSDGTRTNIWANRYSPVTGWGTAVLIEADNAGNALYPQIAVDANGNAAAVWQQSDGTRTNIWAIRYSPIIGWGAPAVIEADNAGNAISPQIAMNPNGNAVAVWQQSDGTRDNIWANYYTLGTGWGAAAMIEADNGYAVNPQVAIDASGNALAVWSQSDNIWANRYKPGTGWGTPELIEIDNGEADYPQIAVDATGNVVAVWRQFDGTRFSIWANRYTSGTGWGTAALIETNNAGNAGAPEMAISANGNAVAVWDQYDGIRTNIWANRYTLGTGWGTAALIETNNAGDAFFPQVATDANGNAVAVWAQYDGTRYNTWANRYTLGIGWGTASPIETENAGGTLYPQIAVDASGNALAVWQQSDGTFTNIWANSLR